MMYNTHLIQKVFITALISVAICAPLSPPNASASLLDAFVLAVDHFDPDHEVGLELDSPEVEFLRQALEMAREAIPEVVGIHIRTDGAGRDKLRPTMFGTLELVDRNRMNGDRTLTPEIKASIASKIGNECRTEIETSEKFRIKSNPRVQKTTLWTFDNYCSEGAEIELCENQEVVRWLCTRGVATVLLIENSYKGRNRAKLFLNFKQVVDLDFKSLQLMADPSYQELFGDHDLTPHLGGLVGDGNSLEVLSDPRYTGFDGVVIKFTVGFGDCPAGCIYSHHWIFKYKTQGSQKDGVWPLIGGLVEEDGTPIPEHMRGQLRKAQAIR